MHSGKLVLFFFIFLSFLLQAETHETPARVERSRATTTNTTLRIPFFARGSRELTRANEILNVVRDRANLSENSNQLTEFLLNNSSCFKEEDSGALTPWYENILRTIGEFSEEERQLFSRNSSARALAALRAAKNSGSLEALAEAAFRYPGTLEGREAKRILARSYLDRGRVLESALLLGEDPALYRGFPETLVAAAIAWGRLGKREIADRYLAAFNREEASTTRWLSERYHTAEERTDALQRIQAEIQTVLRPPEPSFLPTQISILIEGYFDTRSTLSNPSWVATCFSGSSLRALMQKHCVQLKKTPKLKIIQRALDRVEIPAERNAEEFNNRLYQPIVSLFSACPNLYNLESAKMFGKIRRLIGELRDPVAAVRETAAIELGQLKQDKGAVSALLEQLIKERVHSIRDIIIESLAKIGVARPDVLSALEHISKKDINENTRAEARSALLRLSPPIARLIRELSQSTRVETRRLAAHQLAEVGRPMGGSEEALARALSTESNSYVKHEIISALTRIRATQPETLRILELRTLPENEPNEDIRRRALGSLETLREHLSGTP